MDVFLSSAKRTFNFSDETCQELSLHKGLRDILAWCGRTVRAVECVFDLCFGDAGKRLEDNPQTLQRHLDEKLAAPSTVANSIARYVISKNGLVLRTDLKQLLRTSLDVAFLGYLPESIDPQILEACAFTCHIQPIGVPASEYRVTMEPVYYRAACQVLSIPHLPAVLTRGEFESVALMVLCGRLRAMRTILGRSRASSKDLFRDFFVSSTLAPCEFQVPNDDVIVQMLSTQVSSKESISTMVTRTSGSSFVLSAPAAVVNGEKAEFGDGILLLNGLVVVTQAKCGMNADLASNTCVGFGHSAGNVPYEYAKAGFPTADYGSDATIEKKFAKQRELLDSLTDCCGKCPSVFLLTTTKPVTQRNDLSRAVKGRTILVHADNFIDCMAPVATCGLLVKPAA